MNNESLGSRIKLWLYLYKGEILGLSLVIMLILALIFAIIYIPKKAEQNLAARLDSKTIGIVDSVERPDGMYKESRGYYPIKDYQVNYHYQIKNEKIKQSELFRKNSLPKEQIIKLDQLKKGDEIKVRYDSRNIRHGRIDME